jgi:hypothetical protein
MAIKTAPPEPDLPDIDTPLRARSFWRLFGWGGAATIALAAVALTSQTEDGGKRLQLALIYANEPGGAFAQIPPPVPEAEAETKRLAAQVRELAADRERLTARIATLERNLEDMTGSIKQQSEQLAAARAANAPPPALSAPATTPAVAAAAPPPAPALPAASETAASWPATTTTREAAQPATPPQAAQPATEPAPPPPVRVVAAPANEPVAAPPPQPDYGIDLGSAGNLDALRIHWAALKANYGPLLVGLHPVAAQHPKHPVAAQHPKHPVAAQHPKHPAGVTYRLVAGPLPNAAEAARFCASFPVTRTGCRPALFNGMQLAEH